MGGGEEAPFFPFLWGHDQSICLTAHRALRMKGMALRPPQAFLCLSSRASNIPPVHILASLPCLQNAKWVGHSDHGNIHPPPSASLLYLPATYEMSLEAGTGLFHLFQKGKT